MRGRHHIEAHGPRVLGTVLRLLLQFIVLVVGLALILASIALGWLPGPGGIPLFLAGLAVLATQFDWARRIRSHVVRWIRATAARARRRRIARRGRTPSLGADPVGEDASASGH